MTRTALLLSGGIDSTALAWGLRPELAITIDYGQRAAAGELRAASSVCEAIGLEHEIVRVNCREVGSGDLVGSSPVSMSPVSEWWPYRNQLLVTLAGAVALRTGTKQLLVGAVATDSTHMDGRPEFFETISRLLELQEGHLTVGAPGISDTSASLCRRFNVPLEILAWCHSCHVAELACGRCRGCMKHSKTMMELGFDPPPPAHGPK